MSASNVVGAADTSLDVEDIVTAALAAAGESDARTLQFLPALRALLDSATAEAGLSSRGRKMLRVSVISQLLRQMQTQRVLAVHPEIEQVSVAAPIVITGLPRTGTTALHNMLAKHPDARAPRLWELLAPAASTDPARREELMQSAHGYVDQYYALAPALRELHPIDASRPDECHRLIGATFTSQIYLQRYHLPSYLSWLSSRDMRPVYEYHRSLLRCLLWQRPGKHIILKCPTHLWHLEALAAVYPHAKVVRLHRDPVATLASASNLTAVTRAATGSSVDLLDIGRQWLNHSWRAVGGLRRGDRPGPQATTLDVRQQDLRTDPLQVVKRICDFAGMNFSARTEARVATYLKNLQPATGASPAYTPANFGLDRRQVEERYGGYCAEFGVQLHI